MATRVIGPGSYPATWNNAMIGRHQKLTAMRAAGINPYQLTKFERSHFASDIKQACAGLLGSQLMPEGVKLAGRVRTIRDMGKVAFLHLEDGSGQIQIFLKKDMIGEKTFQEFKAYVEVGDFLGFTGDMFKTRTGEITLQAKQMVVLCKSLRPLPEKFHGLSDEDTRQRHRSEDLLATPESKLRLAQRSEIVWQMRQFLHDQGCMEVETPILQELHGGANAKPFITHHNALDMDLYLRIATEIHLKRLIVGGYERVFEIGRIFRNEGIDRRHNPEFTSMEIYIAYANLRDMMQLTEDMVSTIAHKLFGKNELFYQGQALNFALPWKRMTMEDAIEQIGGVSVIGLNLEQLKAIATERQVELEEGLSRGWVISALFEALAEKKLFQPTFIYKYPVETTPLAKRDPNDPDFCERFELFVAGMELANAYSELNDPIDQRLRLEEQAAKLLAGDEEANPLDEDFIRAIEIGMPPTGGMGIGIDRLAMLLTDTASIRDVVLFPTMKPVPRKEG